MTLANGTTAPSPSAHRIFYVSSRGIPTPVAHGHGMVKMCEAYVRNGAEVELWRPYRHRKHFTNDVFGYYEIPPVFTVRTFGGWVERSRSNTLKRAIHKVMTRTSLWGLPAAIAIRRRRPSFCHTRDPGLAFWFTILGIPTVYEAHDVPWRAGRTFVRRLRRKALVAAIGLTSYIRDDLSKLGVPAEKLHAIPNGVDLTHFRGLPSMDECRERLDLPRKTPLVGYIGRFVLKAKGMEKGIPQLIEAIGELRSRGLQDVHLVCVGGPAEVVPRYEGIADRLGLDRRALRFVDRVSPKEVPYWIRACDVVAIPSDRTPFNEFLTSPLKLFEYMAAGAAIVATALPSVTPFLRNDGNAILVEPGNPAALAQGLSTLLRDQDLRRRIGVAAANDAEGFSWEQRAATILSIAKQALV